MNIWQKWNSISLVKRILVGLVIGAILGFCVPAGNEVIALLGDLFVGALKAVAPVLVFFLVISALANAKSAGLDGNGHRALYRLDLSCCLDRCLCELYVPYGCSHARTCCRSGIA